MVISTRQPRLEETAIVTGSGRGVGRAIALELANAGAAVALAARSGSALEDVRAAIADGGGRTIAVPTDVTNASEVAAMVAEVGRTLGAPTLLVNNAGSWGSVGPVVDSDPETWWHDVEVSLKGSFLCTRATLPTMLRQGRGRIVNVASYAAITPNPYMTAYACAKAAVLRFTDSLSAELEGSGVRAFCITPGFVRTQMVERAGGSEAGRYYLPKLRTRSDALEPKRAGRLVVDIASGRLDALAGRFLHVLDDPEQLLESAERIRAEGLYQLRLDTLTPEP
jgi:NAD(P)-dependent dehydrogenase (short-subunit alcohol dehydrogenase family)